MRQPVVNPIWLVDDEWIEPPRPLWRCLSIPDRPRNIPRTTPLARGSRVPWIKAASTGPWAVASAQPA